MKMLPKNRTNFFFVKNSAGGGRIWLKFCMELFNGIIHSWGLTEKDPRKVITPPSLIVYIIRRVRKMVSSDKAPLTRVRLEKGYIL